MTTIAIIGGGFSGAILALNLMAEGAAGDRVVLIEKRAAIGLGQAYSTDEPTHLLNIPASGMSPFTSEPDAFVEFLAEHRDLLPSDTPSIRGCYAPRAVYGLFLAHLVETRLKPRQGRPELTCIHGTATDIIDDRGNVIFMEDGRSLRADRIVLATGNLPPRKPARVEGWIDDSAFYLKDPWSVASLDSIAPNDRVLLLGAGLTMIDVALSLNARGHRGGIIAISRHGLLPRTQEPVAEWKPFIDLSDARSVRRLVRLVRSQITKARSAGQGWQSVLNSLRPFAQPLWLGFSEAEQARFIRHVRPWWDAHRHRIAPAVGAKLSALIATGRLRTLAGRLKRLSRLADGVDVEVKPRAGVETIHLRVDKLINCSGPNYDFAASDETLLKRLIDKGRIRLDRHRLGVAVTDQLTVLDRDGAPSRDLYALGPMLRGQYWETNAVPEIAAQAEALAQRLWRAAPQDGRSEDVNSFENSASADGADAF
jgi:uncharacterized NAD(P)/FAD-binding protein YdhS